jgi:hypothetical protein
MAKSQLGMIEMTEQPKEYIITEAQFQEFFQYFKTQKDSLLAKRAGDIISDISSSPVSTPPVPDSTHLIEMAKTEWKNREERRGIHNREDWCCGWMAGFLSVNKPDWSKEHDAAKVQAARENVLDEIDTWLDSWLKGCSLSGTEAMRVCDFFGYLRKHKE